MLRAQFSGYSRMTLKKKKKGRKEKEEREEKRTRNERYLGKYRFHSDISVRDSLPKNVFRFVGKVALQTLLSGSVIARDFCKNFFLSLCGWIAVESTSFVYNEWNDYN